MKHNKSLTLIITLWLGALLACDVSSISGLILPTPTPIPPRIEIGVLPDHYQQGSLVFSDDGETYAFIIATSGGKRVVQGEQEGRLFSQISGILFSPITNKLFYWALDESSSSQQIVLVADGAVIPTDFAGEGTLRFSQDGQRWAAIGGKPSGEEVIILADGKEIGRYPDASYPSFGPNGEHLAYLVQDKGENINLIIDGNVQKTYPKPQVEASFALKSSVSGPNLPPLFSVDYLVDGRLLILTQDQNGWTVYKGDMPISSYPHNIWGGGTLQILKFEGFEASASILASSINVAESAPLAIWWERLEGEEEQWRVVKDGEPMNDILCAQFWSVQSPVLSADGLHYAYPCFLKSHTGNEDDIFVIADGTKYGPYKHVWGITFSKDGQHFAYAASDGSENQAWSYYMAGESYSLKYDTVWAPKLSDDGSHVAWTAERDDEFILTVDGEEVGSGDEVLWGPEFDQFGNVAWIVREGNKIIRLTFVSN